MKPLLCNYYVTLRCNARCSYCSIHPEPGVGESSASVVSRNLGDAKLLGVRIVDFTGGEPLLYEGLPEALAYAGHIGLKTTVTTNGILYDERAEELAGLIDILQFSLGGADRESHDAVTGVPSFDAVMKGVETALSLGDNPTVVHTVTDENLDRVPDVVALARKLGVLIFLNPCFSYFGNDGLSPVNVRKFRQWAHGSGVAIDRGFLRFFEDGGNRCESPRCLAVSSTIVISPDDYLVLPCFHHKTKALPINGRLAALYSSPEVQGERDQEGRYPFCEGCAINCYMRASLFRRFDRYFLPSVLSAGKYVIELYKQKYRIFHK